MAIDEDLGLTLGLNFPVPDRHSYPLCSAFGTGAGSASRRVTGVESPAAYGRDPCSGPSGVIIRAFHGGIDVNRTPATAEYDEAGVSSPNSAVSSVSVKRCERDSRIQEEHEAERACSRGVSDEEEGDNSRKKLRLSKDQSSILEDSFKEHNTLNPKQKLALAKRLSLRPRQVEVWFQNRRARTKLKQTEVDCEFLKRCCENLTEENRRLLKEVQELRALKLSPRMYMQMAPPTTLTMCPSCERVSVAHSSGPLPDTRSGYPTQLRPIPINSWPIPHRSLDLLQPRS